MSFALVNRWQRSVAAAVIGVVGTPGKEKRRDEDGGSDHAWNVLQADTTCQDGKTTACA